MRIRKLAPFGGMILGVTLYIAGATNAGARQTGPRFGDPLPGLTQNELQSFNAGRDRFLHNASPPEGLGPVFNGVACAECHQAAAPGGAANNLQVARVTRIGAITDGQYSDLPEVGGPLIQRRSLREFNPSYPIPGEVIPPEAQFVSRRITTPLFGDGLIDSIADSTILKLADVPRPDGIHGVPNMVVNPETGAMEVGKFGWKAQVSRLRFFSADALVNEIGITNLLFPDENRPQGHDIPPGADGVPDPEDLGAGVQANLDFMRFLAPPPKRILSVRGAAVFANISCSACHVPMIRTGLSNSQALSDKPVALYSDLLLHDMGPGLDDGVRQGQAQGRQWRTAPLWGLVVRPFLMHDGRATTIEQAIMAHGGEARASRDRFVNLSLSDRTALLAFLRSL